MRLLCRHAGEIDEQKGVSIIVRIAQYQDNLFLFFWGSVNIHKLIVQSREYDCCS